MEAAEACSRGVDIRWMVGWRRLGIGKGGLSKSWCEALDSAGLLAPSRTSAGAKRADPRLEGESTGMERLLPASLESSKRSLEPALLGVLVTCRFWGASGESEAAEGSVKESFRAGDDGRYCVERVR